MNADIYICINIHTLRYIHKHTYIHIVMYTCNKYVCVSPIDFISNMNIYFLHQKR